jgi:membrane associated rhomboid family serine protease
MARSDSTTLTLPPFSGVPRLIMLAYIAVFLTLAILPHVAPVAFVEGIYDHLALWPFRVAMGQIWQLVTYAFMPVGILASVFAMLTVWTCGFILEGAFGARWLAELYFFSAAGGALLGGLISFTGVLGISPDLMALGPFAPIYGLLIVIAVRFGDLEFFLLPTVRVKAKYMVAIFLLVDIASLLTSSGSGGRSFGCGVRLSVSAVRAAARSRLRSDRALVRLAQSVLQEQTAARGEEV